MKNLHCYFNFHMMFICWQHPFYWRMTTPNLSNWNRQVRKVRYPSFSEHFTFPNEWPCLRIYYCTLFTNKLSWVWVIVMGHVGENILQDVSYPCAWFFTSNPSNSSMRLVFVREENGREVNIIHPKSFIEFEVEAEFEVSSVWLQSTCTLSF